MRRSTQRRVGVGLMVGALVGAVLWVGPAGAQEDDEATEAEAPVQAHALLTHPINDVVPSTVYSGFPPQVVCVLVADLCPEELEPFREPIAGILKEVEANQETSPLQPANPEALTISFLAGAQRYSSAIQVEMPTIPDGEELDDLRLTFTQGQPSYSVDSPAFRRVVMALIQTAGSQDPEVFVEQMSMALEEEPLTQPVLGMEACPLLVPIPEDAVAPQSAPIAAISDENADGELEPAVDCLYGANGSFDEDAGTWSFDLTSAARAWADGSLDDHGILLRATGAPNLAFGDADISTNARVVLDLAAPPTATYTSSEPPPPVEPLAPASPEEDASPEPDSTPTDDAPSTEPSPSSTGSSAPPSAPVSAAPPTSSSSGSAPSTDVPSAEVAPPAADSAGGQDQTVALDSEPVSTPSSGPWAWLLVPVFAAGAWLITRALTEDIPAAAGPGRGGALTRLVEGTPAA